MSVKLGEPSSSMPIQINKDYDLFHQDLKHLEPLDEILRCRICFEYFNVCMMTACSHNYCSLCIRKYMTYKSQCPTCFQETSEPELRNNRLIDEIVKAYKAVRESCELYYQGYARSPSDDYCSIESESMEQMKNVPKQQETDTSTDCIIEVSEQPSASQNKVPCPVCSVPVLEKNINLHLDSCLSQRENATFPSPSKVKRTPLPKVVYHLLSDRDLRKKLRECGLSTVGDRQALIRRHKNYLVAYNSECDSLHPKPVEEIVKIVESEEVAEKKCEKQTKVFHFDKRSDPEIIEQQQLMYMRQHNQQFSELIEDIHIRRQQQILESVECASDPEISVVDDILPQSSSPEITDECTGKGSVFGHSSAIRGATDSVSENDTVAVTSINEKEVIILDDNGWSKDVMSCEEISPKDSSPPVRDDVKIARKTSSVDTGLHAISNLCSCSLPAYPKRQVSNLRKRKIVENLKMQSEPPDQKK